MSTLKIGIVEDEFIIAEHIANILIKLGYEVAEPAGSFAEAIEMIEDEKPDLLLIDIQVRGKRDGIDLAKKINEDYKIPFIFLTANADNATIERAKKVNPASYLIKPFTKDDLYAAIEICIHNSLLNKEVNIQSRDKAVSLSNAIFIKDGQLFNKVKYSEILYLESDHVYVNVHTSQKTYLVRSSLQDYLANFDSKQFFRIHRSYVINLEHVQSVNGEFVIVNNVSIPISKSFRDQLYAHLNLG